MCIRDRGGVAAGWAGDRATAWCSPLSSYAISAKILRYRAMLSCYAVIPHYLPKFAIMLRYLATMSCYGITLRSDPALSSYAVTLCCYPTPSL
eukprot:660086-Rhodomonas_salina.1